MFRYIKIISRQNRLFRRTGYVFRRCSCETTRLLPKISYIGKESVLSKLYSNFYETKRGIYGGGVGLGVLLSVSAFCYKEREELIGGIINELCQCAANPNASKEVESYIISGRDVNKKHPLGWSVIHSAAVSGNTETMQLLLDAGADPNLPDEFSTIIKVASMKQMLIFDVLTVQRCNKCFVTAPCCLLCLFNYSLKQ